MGGAWLDAIVDCGQISRTPPVLALSNPDESRPRPSSSVNYVPCRIPVLPPNVLRRKVLVFLRLTVGSGLLVWVLTRVELKEVGRLLVNASALALLLATGVQFLRLPAGGLRWRMILQCHGVAPSVGFLTRLNLVAAFFSQALPTAAGGDLIKGVLLNRAGVRPEQTVASILFDRASGIAAAFAMAGLAAFLVPFDGQPLRGVMALIGVVCISLPVIPLIARPLTAMLERVRSRCRSKAIASAAHTIELMLAYCGRWRFLFRILGVSLLFQVGGVLSVYALARAIGAEAPLESFFIFLPLVWVITMLPVSISGIGLRESAFVWLFAEVQGSMGRDEAVAVALLTWMLGIVTAAVGGLVYMRGNQTHAGLKGMDTAP